MLHGGVSLKGGIKEPEKDPSAWSLRGLLGRNVRSMSECYENTLQLKDLSDASDEHQLPIVFRVLSVGLDELRNCTSHKVGLIYLKIVTDGGHLVLEEDRETKTGLVVVFLHMQFLSSSWIR